MQRAPSSRNGGGYQRDARPPPKMEEGGKTINCILMRRAPSSRNGGGYQRDARPPPEMEEGGKTINCILTRRAPSSRNGGGVEDDRFDIHTTHFLPSFMLLILSFLFGQLLTFLLFCF